MKYLAFLSILALFSISSLGCGGESRIDRYQRLFNSESEWGCACDPAPWDSESECLDRERLQSGEYECLGMAFDTASDTDLAALDCEMDKFEAFDECFAGLACDDDEGKEACHAAEAARDVRCPEVSDDFGC